MQEDYVIEKFHDMLDTSKEDQLSIIITYASVNDDLCINNDLFEFVHVHAKSPKPVLDEYEFKTGKI